jgi:transcriptional regulator of heat shock response
MPFVKEALAAVAEGGYPEALARIGYLLMRKDEPLPLARLQTKDDLARDYAAYLPAVAPEQFRLIRGEQEIIARYEPEQALASLPQLLHDTVDRKRMLTLLDKLMADERVQAAQPTEHQLEMLGRIRGVLSPPPPGARRAEGARAR